MNLPRSEKIIIYFALILISLSSLSNLYKDRIFIIDTLVSVLSAKKNNTIIVSPKEDYVNPYVAINHDDVKWAKKLLKGGYILHFRHAERDKWLDVQIYDVLESDVHENGIYGSRYAENDYFSEAVCLNSRGKIQAKAMKEHIENIGLPIGYVISSPSCRARQTADITFGGYDKQDRMLVHSGPYLEDEGNRINRLKEIYLNLKVEPGTNTIVTAHGSVIAERMFDNDTSKFFKNHRGDLDLEEGGFFVISNRNEKLTLEHEFHNYNDFNKVFYER